jgi:hypothetical protein
MSGGLPQIHRGQITLDDAPGLGVNPVWAQLPIALSVE